MNYDSNSTFIQKYNGKTVLKNISLNIEKGMSTALIGKMEPENQL